MNWNIFKFKKIEIVIFSFLSPFFHLYTSSEVCKAMHIFLKEMLIFLL